MRLEHCLLASALLHALVFVPGWSRWTSPLAAQPANSPERPLQIHLQPPPARVAGSQTPSVTPALPGQPQARPESKPRPVAPPLAPTRPRAAAPGRPTNFSPPQPQKGYPVSHPTRIHPKASAPPSSHGAGEIALDPPAMLKGPENIPIPAFLRNRDGQFLMTLRCRVEKDGSTRVEVMEGTGAPPLDEAVRQSFSGLLWYRAELAGQPVAVTVRLVIEGSWETGQDAIHWGGRIPPME